jgi:uncharacterized damage-inducible protein DinB
MVTRRIWFDRRFELGLPLDALPDVLERVRGTPARVEERVLGLSRELTTRRTAERWSIQENVGHLLDLEPLWLGRVEDLLDGLEELRAADLENRKTHEADHNLQDLDMLLLEFRSARLAMVAAVETHLNEWATRSALHPRLQQPMTVVDLLFFVAEHDDHHLACISDLLRGTA